MALTLRRGDATLNALHGGLGSERSGARCGSPLSARPAARRRAQQARCAGLPAAQARGRDAPCRRCIGDYTDFYTSLHHATAVGTAVAAGQPLLPNYKWVPIGYHGRAPRSASPASRFQRPVGPEPAAGRRRARASGRASGSTTSWSSGVFIGAGNAARCADCRSPQAESHIFGLCLLNDWSARDLQAWEYQPLGPFLAKNFATTISPWIVTLEALAPYPDALDPAAGEPAAPALPAVAAAAAPAVPSTLQLEVYLETETMRAPGTAPHRLSHSNFRHCYWSVAQMVAHHTSQRLQPAARGSAGHRHAVRPDARGRPARCSS